MIDGGPRKQSTFPLCSGGLGSRGNKLQHTYVSVFFLLFPLAELPHFSFFFLVQSLNSTQETANQVTLTR